ncbi:MAG TPA: adenosine deaminase [Gemmatimonadales bacterium]|jgi:adenosine deaminase|nr:adenosine deaminase [Gemmatimonadales bacterium]
MAGLERLVRLPKAELHVHLDGSLRSETLLELGRRAGVPLPAADPAGLRRAMRADHATSLADYLKRFDLTVAVLQTPEALERVAREMVADAALDGVRYLEVRYCPQLSRTQGLSLDEVIQAVGRGLAHGEREHGVKTGLICCTLRHFDPSVSDAIAEAAVRNRAHGVVGFDIAGGEADFPARPHAGACAIAARGGLGVTVHAGEAAGAASIREAVFDCRADRIGHGTRLGEDPGLLEYVRDREIPIEINLTSNVQTRAVPDLASHPVRRYLDQGLTVTLGSDNWLISGVTLSSEYRLAATALGMGPSELRVLLLNGFRAAFLPLPARQALLAAARGELEAWC